MDKPDGMHRKKYYVANNGTPGILIKVDYINAARRSFGLSIGAVHQI